MVGAAGFEHIRVPFEWGEYLIWKRPRSKVSIDGRFRTVYPEEVIQRSWNFTMGRDGWREIIEQYPTEIVLTRRSEHGHFLLRSHASWEQVYEDALAGIWIPRSDPPSPLLRKLRSGTLVRSDEALVATFP